MGLAGVDSQEGKKFWPGVSNSRATIPSSSNIAKPGAGAIRIGMGIYLRDRQMWQREGESLMSRVKVTSRKGIVNGVKTIANP